MVPPSPQLPLLLFVLTHASSYLLPSSSCSSSSARQALCKASKLSLSRNVLQKRGTSGFGRRPSLGDVRGEAVVRCGSRSRRNGADAIDKVENELAHSLQGNVLELKNKLSEYRGAAAAKKNEVVDSQPSASSRWPGARKQLADDQGQPLDKILTAAALVAGNMVGAGILALPSVAAKPGFVASSGLVVLSWLASTAAGLLVAEAWCAAQIRGSQTSIEAMATEMLGGIFGKAIGLGFLFYNLTLLVAYISQGGAIVRDMLKSSENLGIFTTSSSTLLGNLHSSLAALATPSLPPILFSATLGITLLLGRPEVLKRGNNLLVVGAFVSFTGLVATQIPVLSLHKLLQNVIPEVRSLVDALPVIVISLSYQNVVPVVAAQLNGNREAIKSSVLIGTGVPVLMYIAWLAAVLGSTAPSEVLSSGDIPASLIDTGVSSPVSSGGFPIDTRVIVTILERLFSLAALITSFIGCTFGQVEELAARGIAGTTNAQDGGSDKSPHKTANTQKTALTKRGAYSNDKFQQQLESKEPLYWDQVVERERLLLYLLALSPPTVMAALGPDLFLPALAAGGGIIAPLLYGATPAAMVWAQRYRDGAGTGSNDASSYDDDGGKGAKGTTHLLATFQNTKDGLHNTDDNDYSDANGHSEDNHLPQFSPDKIKNSGENPETLPHTRVQSLVPGGRPVLALLGASSVGLAIQNILKITGSVMGDS